MMRIIFLTIYFFLVSLSSLGQANSNKQMDEGNVELSIYSSQEIGWTMKIPKGWTVMSKDRLAEIDKKGLDAIEEVVEGDIDVGGLKHLISFSKNKFNSFQSTMEPFKIEYEGEWEDNNAAIKDIILTAYKNRGIKAKASEIMNEEIDGLKFQKYSITIYSPKGDIIINQLMYSRLINGFDFGVALNYNNEIDKNQMLDAWRGSTFSKRK